jgi:hypothetical protein
VGQWEHCQRFWTKVQLRLVWNSDEVLLLEGATEESLAAASPGLARLMQLPHRLKAQAKALSSPYLADDDYVCGIIYLPGGIVEELMCGGVVVFAFCCICGSATFRPSDWGLAIVVFPPQRS